MKTSLAFAFALSVLLAPLAAPLQAQEPVTTGIVQAIAPESGDLTVLSDQTHKPITFFETNKAMLMHARGEEAHLADLKVGMPVTVQYAVRNDRWYVSKVIFGDEAPAATTTAAGTTAAPSVPPTQTIKPATIVRNRSNGNAPR